MELPPEILKCFPLSEGGCYPDWDQIESLLFLHFPDGDMNKLWTLVVREWLSRIGQKVNAESSVSETESLVVLAPFTGEQQTRRAQSLEHSAQEVKNYLGNSLTVERVGKPAVLIFPDSATYSNYIAQFYPEDSVIPMSGGLCLAHTGYVHLAMYFDPDFDLHTVFVHELTHAYLSHLNIPAWMNEALAMRMEGLVADNPPFPIDREIFARHQAYWNEETLQQFVTGESWDIPGDSFELSYQLAEIMWKKIETNLDATLEEIQDLIVSASWNDGGEFALQEIFGIGLNDLFKSFLGKIAPSPASK